MKNSKAIVFLIVLFIVLLYTQSCTDKCDVVVCQNSGICNEGICECPDGYTGIYCDLFEHSQIQTLLNDGITPLELLNNNVSIDSLYGKMYEGGLIFYLNEEDGTGFVAATVDQDFDSQLGWGCMGTNIIGINDVLENPPLSGSEILPGSRLGEGKINTVAIIQECGEHGIPAKICSDLSLYGKSDWFLPSRGELAVMYYNLKEKGYSDFSDGPYWSSTEISENGAWVYSFLRGQAELTSKNFIAGSVRPIRSF